MTKFIRMTLAASVAALTLTSAPAVAAPTGANPAAQARARIVKPLTLVAVADLNFGDIVVQDAGTATIDMNGVITCTVSLACAATGTAAEYTVTGTNNQVVTVTKPNATLTNTDGSGATLTLVLNGAAAGPNSGPTTVQLPNSGVNGANFTLGGSIAIAASTREGLYEGDLNVTVDYQ
jgi:hypothetical protein